MGIIPSRKEKLMEEEIDLQAVVEHKIETEKKIYKTLIALAGGWWFKVVSWVWDKEENDE
jgi:hypothetical protein